MLPVGPTISLAMGERGGLVRLLAAKYGGYLTFAAMSPERASAPGQPDIQLLRTLYNYPRQRAGTKLFGIIGNPVSHSRSPLIHNTAFQHLGGRPSREEGGQSSGEMLCSRATRLQTKCRLDVHCAAPTQQGETRCGMHSK